MRILGLVVIGLLFGIIGMGDAACGLGDAVQINNKPGGWQIFPGQGYRYGPSIIANADGSIDMWFAASCYDGKHWDQIRYRHSPDGGKTWTLPDDEVVVTPTDDSPNKFSCCDPGAIRFGGYYYVGYTAVDTVDGTSNHVFLARSKLAGGPYEKWNGKGWGWDPAVFLRYTGDPKKWGCGEPSFVLKDGKLYVYYSWNDGQLFVNLAVCNDPTRDDWPAHMVLKGHVLPHKGSNGEDSIDVKYVDSLKRFVAVATYNRIFSVNATVSVWQSPDGISWQRTPFRGTRVQTGAHNMGISGNEIGHISAGTPTFISYSYGWPGKDMTGQDFGWANWATFIDPIELATTGFGQPVHVEVSSQIDWSWSGPLIVDGDAGTCWSSAKHDAPDAEEWASVWLGGPFAIDGLEVTQSAGGLGFPAELMVENSRDGKTWTFIRGFRGNPNPDGAPQKLMFGKTVTASRFRILATKLSKDDEGAYSLRLGEISTIVGHR